MIISHKYKFIFIKTVKTAGTSIEIFLSQFCNDDDVVTPIYPPEPEHLPRNYRSYFNPMPEIITSRRIIYLRKAFRDLLKKNKFYNHMSAHSVKSRIPKNIWDNYYKFCVERNPWDKTLSHYHMLNHRSGNKLSFENYISKGNFCLNYPFYTDGKNQKNIILDRVIKYEYLSEELTQVFKIIRIPFDGHLKTKAKSRYRKNKIPYQEVFSDYQREVIKKSFEKEIKLHGYTFE